MGDLDRLRSIENLQRAWRWVRSSADATYKSYLNEGAKFIRSLDIKMNHVDFSKPALVNPPPNAESERTRVQPGDVLMTITGSRIGRVAPVPEEIGEAYISQHVAILRPAERLRSRSVSAYLSHPLGGQSQIRKLQCGQTKPGLNLNQIRKFTIPIPSLKRQDAFLEHLQRVDAIIDQEETSQIRGELMFKSLLHQAFSKNL